MGRCLTCSSLNPFKFHQLPTSIRTFNHQTQQLSAFFSYLGNSKSLKDGIFGRVISLKSTPSSSSRKSLCTKAVLSETQYPKVGAQSTGPIPGNQLLEVVEKAAKTGAEVVMDAVNKPRKISYKGLTDLVTETDKLGEAAILEVVKTNFKDHLILGEEGGIIGDSSSDYLWCIDPLDGTTNFAHGYPSFAVSVGVLFRGKPAAAAVVERSLLVTGFGYEHDDAWVTNLNLFKEFTDVSRGVRRLGAAAVDMCHVAIGIVEEAGGAVSRMDGGKFCVYDRSVIVSNGLLHSKLLEKIGPATETLKEKGIDFSWWFKPENYSTDL
ncbi:Phosphatase IMPL1 chloroplastic [Bienertia sinuspersici]